MSTLLDSLLAPYGGADHSGAGRGLEPARRAALAAVRESGLPPARSEAWKYTSLRALERRSFAPVESLPALDPLALALPAGPRLVFVNGVYAAEHSDPKGLPAGVRFQPQSQVRRDADRSDPEPLNRDNAAQADVFVRLDAAVATEGLWLQVAPGIVLDTPIHLVLLGAPDPDRAWHLRHQVRLGAGASLRLIEHRIATGPHAHLSNEQLHVDLGEESQLFHARLQDDATDATLLLRSEARLAARAHYQRVDLELGAALSRHELAVELLGEGARLGSNGVQFASGRRHLDTRLAIRHRARDTVSDLRWRGLGVGRGRVVFHGGISIDPGADGSEATLANKNLLLSEGAEIDTQPVLEIHADEVKAAHGATVGRLDPVALFYLRTRGLPERQARAILTAAFCREVLLIAGHAESTETLSTALDAALPRLELG
jgi:Fe-S cluster assembly protein SufD